jgi:hypothetical protein
LAHCEEKNFKNVLGSTVQKDNAIVLVSGTPGPSLEVQSAQPNGVHAESLRNGAWESALSLDLPLALAWVLPIWTNGKAESENTKSEPLADHITWKLVRRMSCLGHP